MKKIQRSFAVEYKSGRRKVDAKPNSIWGNMDLKSVARHVEEEAMPILRDYRAREEASKEDSSPKANRVLPTLTPPESTLTTTADTQEMFMADDTDTIPNADAPAIAETPVEPKSEREPRGEKASSEMAAAETAAEPAVGLDGISGQRRGRKAKVIDGAAVAKRAYVKRAPKADLTATAAPTSAGDEVADLLQLEEENQKLRKLLAEKLRAENAGLRKKLKLD